MGNPKMRDRKALALMTALVALSIGSLNSVAQFGVTVKYNGIALVRGEDGSALQSLNATEYYASVLAKIDEKGYFPLLKGNSTYNFVLVKGTNVTFMLSMNSTIFYQKPSQSANFEGGNGTGYALMGPYLLRISGDVITEISVLSHRDTSVELIEAKVGGQASAMISGQLVAGQWIEGLYGWIFPLDWTREGDLSGVLVRRNNTLLSFVGVIKPVAKEVKLESSLAPYKYSEFRLDRGTVYLTAYGPAMNLSLTDAIPVRAFLGIYASHNGRYIVEVSERGHTTYAVLSPKKCDTCVIGNITYSLDPKLKLDVDLKAPDEVVGGTLVNISIDPGNSYNLTVYLPGGRSLLLENRGFRYDLRVNLPPTRHNATEHIYVTGFLNNGIFGLERGIRVLKAYDIRLLNETRVYLIGGSGDLHVFALNKGQNPLSLIEARLNLTTKRGDALSLKFPLSIELKGNGSQEVLLPLSLPIGDYRGSLYVLIKDGGEIHEITLGEVSIISTGEDPLNAFVAISPDLPSVGDEVNLKITFTSMVPLSRMLVIVNTSEELRPVNDTSKLLKDIPEGSSRELSFLFKAVNVGPASLRVKIYYSVSGKAAERIFTKDIRLPVGGVSGRAKVDVGKSELVVGEQFTIRIRVENVVGNVSIEFPRKMSILEAKGRIKENVVEFNAPGEVEVIGSFTDEGTYMIPTYISVNGSLLIPSNRVVIKVSKGVDVESMETSLRSKLADLMRRFKTLKETLRRPEPQIKERLNEIGIELEEAEKLIDGSYYSKAADLLGEAEAEISSLEEYAYSSLNKLMEGLIYFLIGVGITSVVLLALRLGRSSGKWI